MERLKIMTDTTAESEKAGIIPLEDSERIRLIECENIIRTGLGSFLEVGRALAEIHDNRLYKETHQEFKQYCKDVWDLGKSRAYQQIDGYRVASLLEEKMSTIGGHFTNERHIRPLTRLKGNDDRLKAAVIIQGMMDQNPKAKLTGALVNKAVKAVKGETVKHKTSQAKKQIDATERVSKLFKTQYNVMVKIISDEQGKGWQDSSKTEAVYWLKDLVKLAQGEE
jgi:hypothetical protein